MRRPLERLAAAALAALLAASPAAAQPSASAFTTGYRYDSDGRATGTIAPDPDGAGPLGFQAVRSSYDSGGRLVKVEKGQLAVWQSEAVQPKDWTGFTIFQTLDTAYDSMDRKVRESASGGGVTASVAEYGYDVDGRLKCTAVRMNPDVWSTPLPDKCVPGPAHAVNGPDRISKAVYDAAGQVTESWDAVGTPLQRREAHYTYSLNGRKLSLTDARGFRAEMSYDGHDRQQRWVFPSKTSAGVADQSDYEEYGYDAGGNRTSLRKRDGSTLVYQYDALNRMTAKIVPERSGLAAAHTRDIHYEYDLRGLVTKTRFDSLAGEGITNAWDGFGRLLSSSSDMGGTARTVGNLYDANGNRIRVTHPDGVYFTYDIDGLDRPTWIFENGGAPVTYFTYDAAGRRASGAWNMTSYAYDPAGRLQTLSHNPAGTDRDHALGFAYNPAGQIVTRSASNDAYAWTGAVAANRPYSVNGQNQYTSAGAATFGYDANGNLASTANAPHSTTYVYDVENRLVSASGTHNAILLYDPLGRLFQVSSGGNIRRLVYDGDALIAEYDLNGSMPHRYVHGNDAGADDPLVWYHNAVYGWRQILFHDHQGSVWHAAARPVRFQGPCTPSAGPIGSRRPSATWPPRPGPAMTEGPERGASAGRDGGSGERIGRARGPGGRRRRRGWRKPGIHRIDRLRNRSTARRDRADARRDGRGPEQDEAAEDDRGAAAQVHPPGQHHQPDRRDADHRNGRRDRSKQRILKPLHRRDDRSGPAGIAERR